MAGAAQPSQLAPRHRLTPASGKSDNYSQVITQHAQMTHNSQAESLHMLFLHGWLSSELCDS